MYVYLVDLGLLALVLIMLHEQSMIPRFEYGPDHERSAAQHHAGAHAVETDLIVPG